MSTAVEDTSLRRPAVTEDRGASVARHLSELEFAPVTGQVRLWLRLEGLALCACGTLLYARSDQPWWLFLVLFLAPDLAMVGYLAGRRVGAFCYNVTHAAIGPAMLTTTGLALQHQLMIAVSLIWWAHVGIDRALGFGLKYPTGDRDTHLGRIVFLWERSAHRPDV
jgi:hypothetical protein